LALPARRALEMIAAGAGISEILNELCAAIDVYVSAVSQVLLMDSAGHQLLPLAGPNFPSTLTAALAPWPVGPDSGCCGTAAATGKRVNHLRHVHRPALAARRGRGGSEKARSRSRVAGRLVGTFDFKLW